MGTQPRSRADDIRSDAKTLQALLDLVQVERIHHDHQIRSLCLKKARLDDELAGSRDELSVLTRIHVHDAGDLAASAQQVQERYALRSGPPDDNRPAIARNLGEPLPPRLHCVLVAARKARDGADQTGEVVD